MKTKKEITDDMLMDEIFENFTDEEIAEAFMKKTVRGLLSDDAEEKEDSIKFINGIACMYMDQGGDK